MIEFFTFFNQQRFVQLSLSLKQLLGLLFVKANSQKVRLSLLFVSYRFNSTDSIALTDIDAANSLMLHCDKWIRFGSGLIVTHSQFTICIFSPDPPFALISHCIPIISTQLHRFKDLGQLSKLRGIFKVLLTVFSPKVQSSITSNSHKILSSSNCFKFLLQIRSEYLCWLSFLTHEKRTI